MEKNKKKGSGTPGSRPQDLDRRFDKTQLRASNHGRLVHRDYAAHFFRWGWVLDRVESRKTKILDIGCGQDVSLVRVLSHSLNTVPKSYVGVDLNKIDKKPGMAWIDAIYDEFNFIDRWRQIVDLGPFDLITCFEMIEHMHAKDGAKLLKRAAALLTPGGTFALSTPVYNGRRMAANHIHEWTIPELGVAVARAGLVVAARHGTFASWPEIKKVCTKFEKELVEELHAFHSHEVLSCFLAPKYPNASRNNVWLLRLA
jgi:2-polyprenyl-3-methyl-5-hydroxy-6-metoxy-1,4-benzoquinol methylase